MKILNRRGKRNSSLTFMKSFLIVFAAITILACPIYGFINDQLPISLTVAGVYGLGFFGFYMMLESLKIRNAQKRLMSLFAGMIAVLLAYLMLESLFLSYGFL